MAYEFVAKLQTQEDRDNEFEIYASDTHVNIDIDAYDACIGTYLTLDETKQLIAYLERAIKVVIHNNLQKP